MFSVAGRCVRPWCWCDLPLALFGDRYATKQPMTVRSDDEHEGFDAGCRLFVARVGTFQLLGLL
jgi:hypothetical protein